MKKQHEVFDRMVRHYRRHRGMCEDCGKNLADKPSKRCPGCEAYREHQA